MHRFSAINDRPEICFPPAKKGACDTKNPHWFYNEETGRCEDFFYEECGGNGNYLETEVDCAKTCRPKCPPLPCLKLIKCAYGNGIDENGCNTCTCNNPCEVGTVYWCVCKQCMCYGPSEVGLSDRYTIRSNRADIVVRVSSYDDIGPRDSHA